MTTTDQNNPENEVNKDFEDLNNEILEIEKQGDIEEIEVKNEFDAHPEITKLKDLLARTQADFSNFKMRSERDREDMMFFLRHDILKRILPRVDDLERMLKNTPEIERTGALYEWLQALEKSLKRDLDTLWVKPFVSIWQELDPHKHEVMTQIPSETPWFIVDEFERGYMLWDRVLRVAKVIVGA